MARVTTEDCVISIPNRFQLVIYACRRARDLSSGNEANVTKDNDKNTVIALREIAEKKLDLMKVWDGVVTTSQKYQPVEETDINDDQAVPLNQDASNLSFDNFEKENAAEKKRKKIYLTQNEIQKPSITDPFLTLSFQKIKVVSINFSPGLLFQCLLLCSSAS